MSLLDIIFLSIALAMDCFTVSIASGFILRVKSWHVILQLSILFGIFQALMPLAGWLSMGHFTQYVESFGHWLAFGLLAFIGGKMVRESFLPEEHQPFNPRKLRTQLLLAIATSIDAFAVGISLAVTGYTSLLSLAEPLVWIGFGSFLFGMVGHLLGLRFGNIVNRYIRPELIGGIILIAIGVKVLLS